MASWRDGRIWQPDLNGMGIVTAGGNHDFPVMQTKRATGSRQIRPGRRRWIQRGTVRQCDLPTATSNA